MADLENLNHFRKQKREKEEKRKAAENRVKFGRTKAEKAQTTLEANQTKRALDNKRLAPLDKEK